MAKVYVSLREDKFTRAIVSRRSAVGGNVKSSFTDKVSQYSVRRPMHGMALPEDSYASMTIVTPSGASKELLYNTSLSGDEVDAKGGLRSSYTTNFIVQSLNESKAEKQQVVQTFGDDYVYFYGQQPVTLQVQAMLPESQEFQYAQEFWLNYGSALRGTRLVLKNARMYLTVAGQVFEGYLTTASTSKRADTPRAVTLNFSMYVTNSYYVRALTSKLNGQSTPSHYEDVKAGDYLRIHGRSAELELGDHRTDDIDAHTRIAEDIGFGKYVEDLDQPLREISRVRQEYGRYIRQLLEPYIIKRRRELRERRALEGFEGPTQVLDVPSPLVQPLSSRPDASSGFMDYLNTALAIAAGGFIIAGAAKALSDDYSSFVAGGGKNGVGGYAYNRIVEPVVGAAETFADATVGAAESLRDAGYRVVRPAGSSSTNGVSARGGRGADTQSVDSIVLDI